MRKKAIKDISKYTNEWIAIDSSQRKVIAHSDNFEMLWKGLKQKAKSAIFYKVPPADSAYSP